MKNKEIITLTNQELVEKVKDEKSALNKMKLNHSISPIENPAKIRVSRRNVARVLTEINKRNKASN